MDPSVLGVVAVVGLALTLLNELVIWKLWPKCVNLDVSDYRKTFNSSLFIDPLVAAIACPMASDIIFAFQWSATCDSFFVLVVTGVSLLLYASSLAFSHRLVEIMSPRQRCGRSTGIWKNTNAISFIFSVGVNVLLTWITLQFALGSTFHYDYYESEDCWYSMLKRNVITVFVFCLTIQVVYALFYASLSQHVIRKFKHVIFDYQPLHQSQEANDIGNTADTPIPQEDEKSIYIYTASILFCLLMAGVLRLSYSICSCHGYDGLVSSLYYTNILIVAKLPSVGLLYWAVFRSSTFFKSIESFSA